VVSGFAERTGNPTIWDCRLRTAEDLDVEAERIERTQVVYHPAIKAETEGASIRRAIDSRDGRRRSSRGLGP